MLISHALLAPILPTLLMDEHRGHHTEMLGALAEASKVVLEPARPGVTVNEATGAWSGVMATASGPLPTVMLEPAVPFARSIGVTVLAAPAL